MGLTDRATALDERSTMDFVLTLRRRWADTLYPALRDEYDAKVATLPAEPSDGHEAAEVMHDLTLYPWFSWMERGQQKMLWRSVQDAVLNRWDSLAPMLLPPDGVPIGSLELKPDFVLPKYYTAIDIHIQPGGVWSDDTSALVYEEGAQIVMLRQNDEYLFHQLFAQTVLPDGPHQRIVDLGCGFGKSTRPLVDRFPGTEVIGIDLSAPNLRLAHATAERMGKPIRFIQADGAATGLESASADVVTGTMFLHEMPMKHVEEVLHEAARLLRPGGSIHFLEFSCTGDPFRDATNYEHGERNNEPWIPVLMDADVIGMCERAGLTGARWTPFDEREHGLSPQGWGHRNEWHFPWAVLSAEKPA
jgi:ubiquinone/menaquinone biosynthesis C-methylase UbiE